MFKHIFSIPLFYLLLNKESTGGVKRKKVWNRIYRRQNKYMCKLAKMDKHFITCIEIMKLTWFGTPLIPIFIFTPIMGWFIPDIFMLPIAGIPILPLLETEAGVFPNTSNKSLLAVSELEELAAAGLNWEKSAKLSLLESQKTNT